MTRRSTLLAGSLMVLALAPAALASSSSPETDSGDPAIGNAFQAPNANFERVSISADGRKLAVAGPYGCTNGLRVTIRFTISQRATGALAEGNWRGACVGEPKEWKSSATAGSGAVFKPGKGQACGLAVARQGQTVIDIFQWCANVRVVAGY